MDLVYKADLINLGFFLSYFFYFLLGRYESLCEFFNCLDSSIRLLRLKGLMPTFTNICPKIECLTDRYLDRFLDCCKYSEKVFFFFFFGSLG